jgi:hypothetical protein
VKAADTLISPGSLNLPLQVLHDETVKRFALVHPALVIAGLDPAIHADIELGQIIKSRFT